MNRITSITLGILLSMLLTRHAAAQWNLARFETERNRVYTTFGLEPALVSSLGYARVISMPGREVQLAGEVGVVTARMDRRDFRTRLGAQTSLAHWGPVRLSGSATFITRGTENTIYKGLNFGADVTGTLGMYRRGWFAAGEFGFDKAIVTHVKHTDWYRTNVYPDAKDGWYVDTGGRYHYGLSGGLSLGSTEVVGRFGVLRTERFKEITPPMYASVGLGFRY